MSNKFLLLSLPSTEEFQTKPSEMLLKASSIVTIETMEGKFDLCPSVIRVTFKLSQGTHKRVTCFLRGDIQEYISGQIDEGDTEEDETVSLEEYEELMAEKDALTIELEKQETKDRLLEKFSELYDHLQYPSENSPNNYQQHLLYDIKWDLKELRS